MTQITIHGGDFDKGIGWFYPREGFVLHKDGKALNLIPYNEIERTGEAVWSEVVMIGGEERLGPVGIVLQTRMRCKPMEVAFVVRFRNGNVLLATADVAMCRLIVNIIPTPITNEFGSLRSLVVTSAADQSPA